MIHVLLFPILLDFNPSPYILLLCFYSPPISSYSVPSPNTIHSSHLATLSTLNDLVPPTPHLKAKTLKEFLSSLGLVY
jgi:hypothetical protein